MTFIREERRIVLGLFILFTFASIYSCSDSPSSSERDIPTEVSGFVNTSDTDEGIEAAKVTILGKDIEKVSYTDSTGYFVFTEVPEGEYTVQLRLPNGYNEIEGGEKQIFVEGATQVELLGEPIRQVSTTVQEGKVDTLSTSSGASVIVDGQNATSELNISIEETEEGADQREGPRGVLIRINPEKAKSSQSFSFNENDVYRITISQILDKAFTGLDQYSDPVMRFAHGVDNETIYSYAKGQIKNITDSKTEQVYEVLEHKFDISSTNFLDFIVDYKTFDNRCSESDRRLYEISDKFTGEKPLILVHGWQRKFTKCTDFKDYTPENKSFEALINQLEEDSRITETYKLYAYKYTSNTSVLDNSRDLYDKIDIKELEPPAFIAHSMGGLVVRGLMTEFEDFNVSGAITLGTPHQGSPTTDLADGVDAAVISTCHAYLPSYVCALFASQGGVFPPTEGFLDLDPEDDLFDELDKNFENLHTFAGFLNSFSEIGDENKRGYQLGFLYMNYVKKETNDGIVPLNSASPDWSNSSEIFEAHDHTAMVKGSNGDAKSIINKITPILLKLSGTQSKPEVSTTNISQITSISAISGGEISNDGGSEITKKGVCWSTDENPDLNDKCTSDGSGSGSFESEISGLSPNTSYFVRAYATNELGTGYGNERSFTTTESENEPPTVQIESGPSDGSTVEEDEVTFSWSGDDDESVEGYEVELEGPNATGFSNDQTSHTFSNLSNGDYTFQVRAIDNEGAKSGWASREFTVAVDSENDPPTVEITGGPSDGETIDYQNPVFEWEGNDEDGSIDEYKVELDGPDSEEFLIDDTDYQFNDLSYGDYEFRVRAIDNEGAKSSWASRDFTIEQSATIPTVGTLEVSSITETSAESGGDITDNGDEEVSVRGVCWSTSETPGFDDECTNNGGGTGEFTSSLEELVPDTKYYVRAYANNKEGIGYGDVLSFRTNEGENQPPTVEITSGPSEGETIDYTDPEFEWDGSDEDGSVEEYRVELNGPDSEEFTTEDTDHQFDDLSYGEYEFRVRAIDNEGEKSTWASREFTVKQSATRPVVTTLEVSSITTTSAQSGGDVTDGGGDEVSVRGVCWSTSETPEFEDDCTNNGSGTGEFTSLLEDLSPDTKYYVRAYATNKEGIGYGEILSFTTSEEENQPPTVEITGGPSDGETINYTNPEFEWSGSDEDGSVDEYVIELDGPDSEEFTTDDAAHQFEDLSYGKYEFQVRAVDNEGAESAGAIREFSIEQDVTRPVVMTSEISSITETSAESGGNVTDDGGDEVSVRGVCWSTSQDPDVNDDCTNDGGGEGEFTSSLEGLSPDTEYYVRAYAVNVEGIGYGDQRNFTTESDNNSNMWVQKADFGGEPRVWAVGFSIDDKGYIGTGRSGDFWEYDPQSDTWTQKADVGGPDGREGAVSFSIGNKGYIGTGFDFQNGSTLDDFWEYDPQTNDWSRKADFAGNERYGAVGFSIGNKGYIGIGSNNQNDFWEYDPQSDTWTRKADFGGGSREGAVGFSIEDKGYIGTGNDQKDFWEYNPGDDSWSQKTNFGGEARSHGVGFSIGNKGYIGTGVNDGKELKDFWEYNSQTDTWVRKSDFGGAARSVSVGFSIGSKGYIGTGFNSQNDDLKDFWQYNQ